MFDAPKIIRNFATWGIAPIPKNNKMQPERGMQAEIGGDVMKNARRKEEEYYFEYDNVYNMEPDELRAESASDTSVWYS